MERKHRHTSRGYILFSWLFCSPFYRLLPPILGTLLGMLPAFFYSCAPTVEDTFSTTVEPVTKLSFQTALTEIKTLDIFVFKDDSRQKLDCYQRFDNMDEWYGTVVSGSGERTVTALANSPYRREDWFAMNSRQYLNKIHVSLEDELRGFPVMVGERPVNASDITPELFLKPLTGEVRLNSISCDFTGKAYAGEKLSDTKVYLTNVNAECPILEDEISPPIRIINAGRFKEEDTEKFREPTIIIQEIDGRIGRDTVYPDISLLCYQSNHPKETPGTPYTRLVIEGKISGRTYYWPININRDTEYEAGVWRGRSYSYDIRITRKGSSDPDMPVEAAALIIKQEVKEWKEKEEYEVRF